MRLFNFTIRIRWAFFYICSWNPNSF